MEKCRAAYTSVLCKRKCKISFLFDQTCKAAQTFCCVDGNAGQLELLVCVVNIAGKLVFFSMRMGKAGQLAMLYNQLLKLGGHHFNSFSPISKALQIGVMMLSTHL